MKARVPFCFLFLALALLMLPSAHFVRAAEVTPGEGKIHSVEERRVLAAIEEQRQRLQQREGMLEMKELELKTLEREVDKKLDELRREREEATALLERKEEAQNRRIRDLSAMYEKMAPEKAAALLAEMEENLAVDILAGMKSKSAGRVLGSMERRMAERLSQAYSKL